MTDIALGIQDGCINILTDSAGLKSDAGLETAVLISLFTDSRVASGQVPSGETSQRGWWGDQFLKNEGDSLGSKMWTVTDRNVVTATTVASVQTRARQALEWMIEDGVAQSIEVTATRGGTSRIDFEVKIKRPQNPEDDLFSFKWDGQELIR